MRFVGAHDVVITAVHILQVKPSVEDIVKPPTELNEDSIDSAIGISQETESPPVNATVLESDEEETSEPSPPEACLELQLPVEEPPRAKPKKSKAQSKVRLKVFDTASSIAKKTSRHTTHDMRGRVTQHR